VQSGITWSFGSARGNRERGLGGWARGEQDKLEDSRSEREKE